MFNRVVLPDPEDPRIALIVPALKIPSTPLRICFRDDLDNTENLMVLKVRSTEGGRG